MLPFSEIYFTLFRSPNPKNINDENIIQGLFKSFFNFTIAEFMRETCSPMNKSSFTKIMVI